MEPSDTQATPTARRAGMAFIFVTILIDVIGFGLVIPVLPSLVNGLAGGDAGPRAYGWLLASYGLMQFIFAPVLGNLSDRFGRRPVLLVSLVFAGLDYILQALAPSLGWLFFGRIIAGVTGASFTAATAYIADVSPPEKRAQNFGMIGAAFGLGFIIGPALGGILGEIGPRVPFWAAAGMALLNFLYGLFVLPESLAPELRRPFRLRNANPIGTLAILGRHQWVLILSLSAGLLWLAQQVPPSTWVLYTTYKFRWSELDNGLAMAVLGLCAMGVQVGVIRFLGPRIGDWGMVAVGFVFNVIGFVAIGFATTGWMMVVALMVWTLCFVGGPAMQSLISKQYGPDEQGAVQGALTSLQSLASVIGPPVLTGVFAHFTRPGAAPIPGAPFFLGALLTVVAAAICGPLFRNFRPEKAA